VARVLFSSLPSRAMEGGVAREIARVLRPNGWLVWLDLRYSSPRNREVHAISRRRLAELFPDWSMELVTAGLLPPIARRLGPVSQIAYPVLSAVPILQSHLVGRLRRPRKAS
jgi:hypothetical protein